MSGRKLLVRESKSDRWLCRVGLLVSVSPNFVLLSLLIRISDAMSGRKRDQVGTCVFNSAWLEDDEFKQWVQRLTSDTEFPLSIALEELQSFETWVQGGSWVQGTLQLYQKKNLTQAKLVQLKILTSDCDEHVTAAKIRRVEQEEAYLLQLTDNKTMHAVRRACLNLMMAEFNSLRISATTKKEVAEEKKKELQFLKPV